MKPVYLTGVSVWSPGFPDARSFVGGLADPAVTDCECAWVPPRLLRGASRLTRMLGEAAEHACRHGGADPRTVATFYTSGYGEIETMLLLLQTIFSGDGQLSPMRFKNSVHNSAAGLCSIGTSNQGFSTALAAGPRSFEAAMIEALVWMSERGGDAVISVADDRLPAPLSQLCEREGLAVGICLRSERPSEGAIATVGGLRQDRVTASSSEIPERFALNPAGAALPLLGALLGRTRARVPLAFEVPRPWSIEIEPGEKPVIA